MGEKEGEVRADGVGQVEGGEVVSGGGRGKR